MNSGGSKPPGTFFGQKECCMVRGLKSKFALVVAITMGSLLSGTSFGLTCSEVHQLMLLYFRMHYSYNKLDDDLANRTLDNFIKAHDPGKLYFFSSDIKEINDKYRDKLDNMMAQLDCSAIDFVVNRFSKRFEERNRYVQKLLKQQYKFDVDESLLIDRKKIKFLSTTEDLNERWRKRIKFQIMSLRKGMSGEKKIKEKLKKRYELAVKRHNDLTRDRVFGIFLNSFSTALDPHSSYMPADELEDFRIRTRLSLEGIGASLRSEEGFTIVASLVKGGAAEKGGELKINDKIIAVAQGNGDPVDVIDMDLQEVVKLIRGARGTVVKLTVIREGVEKNKKMRVAIVREKIQLVDQQASSKAVSISVMEGKGKKKGYKVGVINLPSFYIDFEGKHQRRTNYRSSSRDTKKEIINLRKKGVDALIVDLRNNGGGSLEESIHLAGLFFDKGPVVQVKAPNGETEAYSDRDGQTYYDGPLVVMINRHSASASEIFAGAIQDYGRGIIVGDSHTFGKGTVQNLNDVAPTLGAIKVTVNQFYRPSGATTQLDGVLSDIKLPSLVDEYEVGEKYYDFALPFDRIKKVDHQMFKLVTPYVKKLRQASQARVAAIPEFQDIFKEIEKFKKNKEERTKVSLKEKSDKEAKNEKEEKKEDNQDSADEGDVFNLAQDIYLQEAIRITGDYLQLLNQRKFGKVKIKGMKKKPKLSAESAKKPGKKTSHEK